MGGRALKNVVTRRYNKEEYETACDVVIHTLYKLVGGAINFTQIQVIQAYKTKETFGDMDVLIEKNDSWVLINESSLQTAFADVNHGFGFECKKNGDVYSFNYKDLQVDLIFNDPKTYNYALNYFSHNDLGNLCGRLAHKFGLKHGHAGLTMPVRNGTHVLGEIKIATDYYDTLDFLGLDENHFYQGFDTLEEMFVWVSKSKYFNPSIYLFENINAVSRIRDKKRPTYNLFLKWCESYTGPVHSGFASKIHAQEIVFDHFAEHRVKEQYTDLCARGALITAAKAKFNGDMVSTITGFKEKLLGAFLAHCKDVSVMFEPHNLYMASQEAIDAEIQAIYSDYVFEE